LILWQKCVAPEQINFVYVKSLKKGLRKQWANDKVTALVTTAIITPGEGPMIATPKAVPDAGGCSISAITITKIESPTASEYTITDCKKEGCGIKEHKEPDKRPTRCPPITLLGLAVMLLGIANTIKAVAPIDAIITACSILKSKSTTKVVRVASRL